MNVIQSYLSRIELWIAFRCRTRLLQFGMSIFVRTSAPTTQHTLIHRYQMSNFSILNALAGAYSERVLLSISLVIDNLVRMEDSLKFVSVRNPLISRSETKIHFSKIFFLYITCIFFLFIWFRIALQNFYFSLACLCWWIVKVSFVESICTVCGWIYSNNLLLLSNIYLFRTLFSIQWIYSMLGFIDLQNCVQKPDEFITN